MSDFTRLEDKLAKLRQRERIAGEGRRLRGATPEALLAAVVTEIDETILPRVLSFTAEGGETVNLAVANRRLQALVSPVPGLKGVSADTHADQPLADAEDAAVAGIKDVLLAVFANATTVAIHSERPTGPGHASDIGVPSNILARVWGAADTPVEELSASDVLTKFLSALGEDALAWLRIEGEDVTDQGGDPALAGALGEQAAVFLDGYFGKFDDLYPDESGPCATLIGPMSGAGATALFVEVGEVSAFIAAKTQTAPDIARNWQKMIGA